MAQANMLGAGAIYRQQRATVYTEGDAQIGFSGLGQGDELLPFPGEFLVGEALKSLHWACLQTNETLVAQAWCYRAHPQILARDVDNRWYTENLGNGNLDWPLVDPKQRHGGRVQANPFAV